MYARRIVSLLAAKSCGVNWILGMFRSFLSFVSPTLRVSFIPVLVCCGEVGFSLRFEFEVAVDAEDIGCRECELLKGGDVLGGGAEM